MRGSFCSVCKILAFNIYEGRIGSKATLWHVSLRLKRTLGIHEGSYFEHLQVFPSTFGNLLHFFLASSNSLPIYPPWITGRPIASSVTYDKTHQVFCIFAYGSSAIGSMVRVYLPRFGWFWWGKYAIDPMANQVTPWFLSNFGLSTKIRKTSRFSFLAPKKLAQGMWP